VTDELDDAVPTSAHRMFGLARHGATEELAAQVDAGLPVKLTNDRGDTLRMLAAYHDHPDTVGAGRCRVLRTLGEGRAAARIR
jgi:uncharacterized protein